MTKLQAAMRDNSAKAWRERKVYYKVGSVFKGCSNCGEVEEDEETGKVKFLTGHEVFRSYRPKEVGWTYKCWSCTATDLSCWSGAIDIGQEPILGNRDAVRRKKNALRKAWNEEHGEQNQRSERGQSHTARNEKDEVLDRLQSELDRVMNMLKGVK